MNLLAKEITDFQFIQTLIPQKQPFVMVDKMHFFSRDKIVSGLTITKENVFSCSTNFMEPGIIENMAQTVAMHTGYNYYLKKQIAPTGYIGALNKVNIHQLPLVGQELITSVQILHDIMGVTLVETSVMCNGTLVAQGEMKTVLAN